MSKFAIAALVAVSCLLAACGSTTTPQPVGIGRGIDKLKGTPCSGGCTSFPNTPYSAGPVHEVA